MVWLACSYFMHSTIFTYVFVVCVRTAEMSCHYCKVYCTDRFVYMVETRAVFPNVWRVVNLSHVLFLGCHWFAAFYFLISKAGGFRGDWGYPAPVDDHAGVAKKYLRSLHWSTLTLTTIGDLPPPETNWE